MTSRFDPVYRVETITSHHLERIRDIPWEHRQLQTVNGKQFVLMTIDDIRVRLYADKKRGMVIDGGERDVKYVMLWATS